MVLATQAGSGLTAALKPLLEALVEDLRERLDDDGPTLAAWQRQHKEALVAKRSAASWTDWSKDQQTQAAVGWILASVFVRFCEDNRLLGGHPGSRSAGVWITSNDPARRSHAQDAESAFYRAHSDFSYREWLESAFEKLGSTDATRELVGEHSAINIATPSSDAINRLLTFWRKTDDNDSLIWDFQDPDLSTRFLGDLYQDLSDYAKDKYALLQTPEFVEEFILDQTLEPALKDRPLEGFKLIDPTCGSGHFLLGAFQRLLNRWHDAAPGLDVQKRVDLALDSVFGVDLNPFAVAIARFRLIIAALQACELVTLIDVPEFKIHVAVGDSLLHGESQRSFTAEGELEVDVDLEVTGFMYATEDLNLLRSILVPGIYDAVVGNPPYIVARDKALNARYRELYKTCFRTYALSVPFMERFFQLAKGGSSAGWVGQITSNSFMKREFGAPLIEKFLYNKDLRALIDTSGAYIPGHGTPTLILVGRNQSRQKETVSAVLGIRGEPGSPVVPAEGLVWKAIVDHVGESGYEDEWISVTELPRKSLQTHPWSLTGGGAIDLLKHINSANVGHLGEQTERIGFFGIMGSDDAMTMPPQAIRRLRLHPARWQNLIVGDGVRDFAVTSDSVAWFPYSAAHDLLGVEGFPQDHRALWRVRYVLESRPVFSGETYRQARKPWWSWHQIPKDEGAGSLSITLAFVATHNHFVLDRGGSVFKQSAPVIKLSADSTIDDHLRLMSILNSSVVCFWLKQNSQKKGGAVQSGGGSSDQPWSFSYEFTGTTLKDLPIPGGDALYRAKRLDTLAHLLSDSRPEPVIAHTGASRDDLKTAEAESASVRRCMIAEQEELDWEVYRLYGLFDEVLWTAHDQEPGDSSGSMLPEIALGQRAFEIVLARRVRDGQETTEWFSRHGSTPITEIPTHWPTKYQELVQKRINLIESDKFIRLLERPEYKRRWQQEPWSKRLTAALKDHLLDRLESRELWFSDHGTPQTRSIAELAGLVETHSALAGFTDALDQWVGRIGVPIQESLTKLLEPEVVPYLAALRYKDSGLRKRADWESVWTAQRAEDDGTHPADADPIPVPPKYVGADFLKASYWSHRGKLDLPKERFISYPGAGRATDASLVLGWAGWDHAQQALALGWLYSARSTESFDPEVLTPLVAGVAELLPWIYQWHSGIDPELGTDLAEYFDGQIDDWVSALGKVREDLPKWRPTAPVKQSRARKPKAAVGPAAAAADDAPTSSADLSSIIGEQQ